MDQNELENNEKDLQNSENISTGSFESPSDVPVFTFEAPQFNILPNSSVMDGSSNSNTEPSFNVPKFEFNISETTPSFAPQEKVNEDKSVPEFNVPTFTFSNTNNEMQQVVEKMSDEFIQSSTFSYKNTQMSSNSENRNEMFKTGTQKILNLMGTEKTVVSMATVER